MTHARRTARACRLTAGLSLTSALTAAAWHPWYAVPGLLGAAILLLVAAAYQVDHIRQQARHEALALARLSDERLLPAPCCRFWEQPDGQHAAGCRQRPADCCDQWWTSCGTHHDLTCPNHTRSAA